MATRSNRSGRSARRLLERLLTRQRRPQPHARGQGILATCLGPLELRALEALWRREGETGVRAIMVDFPGCAYTTVMTTLDRLYKKDFLVRRKSGRAYLYAPRYERAELEAVLARDALDDLLDEDVRGSGPEPILMGFVDAVGRRDARMLDELERLVRRYRSANHDTGEGESG